MEQLSIEFIQRCKLHAQPHIEILKSKLNEYHYAWQKNNYQKFKDSQKKYEESEKGKIAARKRNSTRTKRFRDLVEHLSHKELQEIKEFYADKPQGYEVDHIIPIAKGGLHHISNLQYLTREENREKSAKNIYGPLIQYLTMDQILTDERYLLTKRKLNSIISQRYGNGLWHYIEKFDNILYIRKDVFDHRFKNKSLE